MKTIIAVLFVCSAAVSQQTAATQSSVHMERSAVGKAAHDAMVRDGWAIGSTVVTGVSTFHYDEPQTLVLTGQWCDLQPERKTRPNPYPSKHSATLFCENKHLMVMTADGAVIDLEDAKAGAQPAATGTTATENTKTPEKGEASR